MDWLKCSYSSLALVRSEEASSPPQYNAHVVRLLILGCAVRAVRQSSACARIFYTLVKSGSGTNPLHTYH
jgi:hypothetical protein